jgi:uncharacterized Zn finger protein (UPF0148 family)
MKALTCEMCGSTNLIKEGGVFVCQSCGTKYSVEEAKKMMVEGTVDVKGTVKVDSSDELKNLYEIARRAKDSDNSENAAKYYDMILIKDPGSWEANYYVVYFQAKSCKIAEIRSAAISISNCLESVLTLIKNNITDKLEQKTALTEILLRNIEIATMLAGAARSHYLGIDVSIQGQYTQEYIDRAVESANILYIYGNLVETMFDQDCYGVAVSSWKQAINIHKQYIPLIQQKVENLNLIISYCDKIRKSDPSFPNPKLEEIVPKSGGCYVATAVYGSYDCPEVWTLRRYRDLTLDETWYGRLFIKGYYATSPTLVRHFGDTSLFKSFGKKILDKLVAKLNSKGFENTPYNDKY